MPLLSVADRLAARSVRTASGCLEWQGAVDPTGYGAIKVGGKKTNTHRVAFTLAHGPIPDGKVVCHRCNNPRCIEPVHLYAGSRAQNIVDAVNAGRPPVRKLCMADAKAIRADRRPAAVIAKARGLAVSTVYKIKAMQTHAARFV